MEEKKLTGYPSIDKPWLKYYGEEAISAPLPECTMYEYVRNNNKAFPEDTALIYFGRKITYRKLIDCIDQTAAAFTKLGVQKGDVVTIQSLTLPQVIVMIYALSKLGAVANLIYATVGAKELQANLEEKNSRVLAIMEPLYMGMAAQIRDMSLNAVIVMAIQEEMDLTTKAIYSIASKAKMLKPQGNVLPWKNFYRSGRGLQVPVRGASDDPVIMVYTGGTTGKSKSVVLSNYNMNTAALQYLYLGFQRQHTMLASLPAFIAFGTTVNIHTPLAFGLKTAVCIGKDPTDISRFIKKYKPNYVIAGVTHAEKLMAAYKDQNIDLSFLHCFSVGGDALPPKMEEQFNEFLAAHNARIQMAQGYAMSEVSAAAAASTRTIDHTVYKPGTIGVPLIYTNVKIVDPDTGMELGYDQDGEICLSSPSIMMGYYQNAEETANVLRAHEDGTVWVHTGDIGSVDTDGFITIVGRVKRMILTCENGIFHKLYPKLLEDRFLKLEELQSIAIVGRPKTETSVEHDLVAFAVLSEGVGKETARQVMEAFAQAHFESYERPYKYIFVQKLPRTTIGKVDYRALEQECQNL